MMPDFGGGPNRGACGARAGPRKRPVAEMPVRRAGGAPTVSQVRRRGRADASGDAAPGTCGNGAGGSGRASFAAQMDARVTGPDSHHTYWRARLAGLLGRRELAGALYRSALAGPAHDRVRKHLARLELPGADYFRLLERLHRYLKPRTYVEVGVFTGKSLRLARAATQVIGVDPAPRLKRPAAANTRVYAEASDAFFGGRDVLALFGGARLDLALIDGMHQFEFALRDFMNLERLCHPGSVILVHDCYPLDARSAARERSTEFWTGDVWRLLRLLLTHRPDLSIHTLAVPPSGLGLILNLDPGSKVLAAAYPQLLAEGLALDYADLERDQPRLLNRFPNDWRRIRALLERRPRAAA